MALDDRILDQAAHWAARTGNPSFEDWDGFTAWLESDPAHARAYDLVNASAADAVVALAAQPAAANDDAPARAARRRLMAGGLAAVLVGVAIFSLWQVRGGTYTVETAPGETRLIALGDAGEITLGGGTTVTLDRNDPRFAKLDKGQALFSIRHDAANPFRIAVGEDELVDIGTVFDVRYGAGLTTVAVAEGAVAFNPAQENVRIDPGHFLSSEEGSRQYELGAIPGSDVGGWRTGRLSFQQTTLAAVADDLTRSTGIRFSASAGAARRRVSGSLLVSPVKADPGSVGPLLGVAVRKSAEGWVLKRASMRYAGALLLAVAVAAPAHAESVAIDVPAGRAGDAAAAIARQTGTSIVITDQAVSNRRIKAIKGRYSVKDAVRKLARAAGAQAIAVGPMGWRLVAAPEKAPKRDLQVAKRPAPTGPRSSSLPLAPPRDIVVVGSKRDILLADYPGEVEMIDGEDLALGGAGGTEKITQRVPTVSSTHLGSGRNKLFIRGIADSSFTGPTQSTVGQYFGDLRLSYNAPDPDLRLIDLQRVEVLEGPQGTLYGAGALGGILRMVPNPPEMGVVSGSAMIGGSATQHGALGGDASATINLPVAGTAALRVTIDAETRGGYIDKPLLKENNVNRNDVLGGRAAFRFETDGGWTFEILGIGQTTAGRDSQYADRNGPPLTRAAQVEEGFDADYAQGQVVVSQEFGDIRFKSSTGITSQGLEERYDATLPAGDPRLFVQTNDTTMIANETRLWQPLRDRFGWLVGASFTSNRTRLTRTLGPVGLPAPTTGVRNDVDEATLYGEASLRLGECLVVSAGGRFTHSWLGGEGEDIALAQLSTPAAQALAAITASRNESAFLPSFSLAANVLPETTLYLRYQEGFRPGGLAIAGDSVTRFKNDHIATLEFGARHGRAEIDPFEISANVSFTRWNDIQADFIDNAGLPSTANIGDGHIWSATVNGSIAAGPDLRFDAGLTYNDSRVDQPSPAFALGRTSQVPNIAHFAGRIGFDYHRELRGDLYLLAQGWVQYIGKSRLGVGPELGEEQGDYLDTGLQLRIGRDDIGLTLGISNLTDEKGNRFALGTPFAIGRDQITPLRPRTIRLGLDASF